VTSARVAVVAHTVIRPLRNADLPDDIGDRHAQFCRFKIATICATENRFFFMTNSLQRESLVLVRQP
jgi:hypothetical protein